MWTPLLASSSILARPICSLYYLQQSRWRFDQKHCIPNERIRWYIWTGDKCVAPLRMHFVTSVTPLQILPNAKPRITWICVTLKHWMHAGQFPCTRRLVSGQSGCVILRRGSEENSSWGLWKNTSREWWDLYRCVHGMRWCGSGKFGYASSVQTG